MTLTVPMRIVLPSLIGARFCVHKISEDATQTAGVSYMSCDCRPTLKLCIAQNADRSFVLQDSTSVDYSQATEITFDIWESATGTAPAILTKTMTGGDIVLANPYSFTFDIDNAESGAMTPTSKYCEAWVVIAGGDRRRVGAGSFDVQDTRKFD